MRVTGQQRPHPAIIYDPVSIPQAPTPPAWSAYPYHVPLPQIPDSTHTNTENTLSVRKLHLPTHINTKHTVRQYISLTNTYKQKTYCPSEHLTQQNTQTKNTLSARTSHLLTHINTKHIVPQDISLTITHKHNPYCRQKLPLVVNISTCHMLIVRNIICS